VISDFYRRDASTASPFTAEAATTRETTPLYSLPKFSHSFAGCRAGFILLLATLVIFSFAARTIRTADSPRQPQQETWPTKQGLWRSIRQSGMLTTVYPSAPVALAGAYRDHYAGIPPRPNLVAAA